MAFEGGIFIDVLTRLNLPSVDRVLREVKTMMKEAGDTSGEAFAQSFGETLEYGAKSAFEPLVAESDAAFRQMQIGMVDLQRAEAQINDLRARNYRSTTDSMIAAQKELDFAIANSQRLMADATKANAAYRDSFIASPLGERGEPGERAGSSKGNNRSTAPERKGNGGNTIIPVGGVEERYVGGKGPGEHVGEISDELLSERLAKHYDRMVTSGGFAAARYASRLGGIGAAIGGAVFVGSGFRQATGVNENLAQVMSRHQDKLHNAAYTQQQQQAIFQLANEVPWDPKQLSEEYRDIENRGYTGDAAIQMLRTVSRTATASHGDLKRTGEGLMTNFRDFGIQNQLMSNKPGTKEYKTGLDNMTQSAGQMLLTLGNIGSASPEEFFGSLGTVEPTAMEYMGGMPGPAASAQVMAGLSLLAKVGINPDQGAHNLSRIMGQLGSIPAGGKLYSMIGQLGGKPEDIVKDMGTKGLFGALGDINQLLDSRTVKGGDNDGMVDIGWQFNSEQIKDLMQQNKAGLSPGAQSFLEGHPQIEEGLASRYTLRKDLDKAIQAGQVSKEEAGDLSTYGQWATMMNGPNKFTKSGAPTMLTKGQAFQVMAGTGDIARTMAILGTQTDEGSTLANNLTNAGGDAVKKGFEEMERQLPTQVKELGSQLKSLAGELAEHALPTVIKMVHELNDFIDHHKEATQHIMEAIGGVAAAWLLFKAHIPQLMLKLEKFLLPGFNENIGDLVKSGLNKLPFGNKSGTTAAPEVKTDAAGASMQEAITQGGAKAAEAIGSSMATASREGAESFTAALSSGAREAVSILSKALPEGAKEAAPALSAGVADGGKLAGAAISEAMVAAGTKAGVEVGAGMDAAAPGVGSKIAGLIGPALAGLLGSQMLADLGDHYDEAHRTHVGRGLTNNPLTTLGPTLWRQGHNFVEGKPVTTDIFGWHHQWIGGGVPPQSLPHPGEGHAFGGIAGYAGGTGAAGFGMMDGWSPGVDDKWATVNGQPVMLSGGEGILVPPAAKALGKNKIDAINAAFSNGRGYATGTDNVFAGIGGGDAFAGLGQNPKLKDLIPKVPDDHVSIPSSGLRGVYKGTKTEGNPWSDPIGVASTLYGSFAKGVAKYSPWGKYLEATSQTFDSLAKESEDAEKLHAKGVHSIDEGILGGEESEYKADVRAINSAYGLKGHPYKFGGLDCSGYLSEIYSSMAGLPAGRKFTTESNFATLGFHKGYMPGALNVGVLHGGSGGGHMAGTLPNGVNVESGGSNGGGTKYGEGAHGANDPQFTDHWWFMPGYAKGGVVGFDGGGVTPAFWDPAYPNPFDATQPHHSNDHGANVPLSPKDRPGVGPTPKTPFGFTPEVPLPSDIWDFPGEPGHGSGIFSPPASQWGRQGPQAAARGGILGFADGGTLPNPPRDDRRGGPLPGGGTGGNLPSNGRDGSWPDWWKKSINQHFDDIPTWMPQYGGYGDTDGPRIGIPDLHPSHLQGKGGINGFSTGGILGFDGGIASVPGAPQVVAGAAKAQPAPAGPTPTPGDTRGIPQPIKSPSGAGGNPGQQAGISLGMQAALGDSPWGSRDLPNIQGLGQTNLPGGPHPFIGDQPKGQRDSIKGPAPARDAIPGGTGPKDDRNIMGNPSQTLTSEGKGLSFGGGLLGAAESLPGMAIGMAGMAGDAAGAGGGGSAAAGAANDALSVAFQLANRAAGYGGQLVGIGIKGIMETFLPNDSPAADPSKNIFGKIALGIAGAHPTPKNSAGDRAMQVNPKQDLDQGEMQAKQQPGIHIENIHNNSGDHKETFAALQKGIFAATAGGASFPRA